ncbi:MAG: ABC transporter substrate-binding protein [Candidatus Thiodiazotropha sp. (ex Lucinoma annulata)]|nr:ABC transporter substrate-binding protein [Candidatus Thiodiazotropha sp. (ex Lucinoma borealis)]MCU7838429.1 ABC transporter substrate-binding protein [Candidatus Thiodiazotropha sp. (ex Troendleina suluensis)]MCU7883361.1 ABC transporter substrate-binding protein [Candidatus Thiodiazotropha sp. (ex Lucinoma annulata)]MCU7947398.1 ABC transporter substrate-binding protein [Candidatus Thiodiazotropha sp. (ex Cardiolucina cf. quadrata)]MCU7856777.1 ABC transporter substrate-binding protein [C
MIRFITILISSLLLTASLPAAANVTPSERIKETVDRILEVMQDKELGRVARRDQVKEIVRKRFDYESMSQVILATNWRKATKPQREQFITLFRELLEQTYFSAMDSYNNQTVRMGRERMKGKLANVQTFIIAANKELAVSYKMRYRNDDWYAYDVAVDGVSLVSNYRTSFRNLVKSKGMDGLLAELAQKVATLKANNKNSGQVNPPAEK